MSRIIIEAGAGSWVNDSVEEVKACETHHDHNKAITLYSVSPLLIASYFGLGAPEVLLTGLFIFGAILVAGMGGHESSEQQFARHLAEELKDKFK